MFNHTILATAPAATTAPATNSQKGTAPANTTQKAAAAVRLGLVGAVMAGALTAAALGLAANSYADSGAHQPTTHTTAPTNNTGPKPPAVDGFGNGTPGYHPTPHHRHPAQ